MMASKPKRKYTPPKLDTHAVVYKGRRYWVIELDELHPFEFVSKDMGDYVVYDLRESEIIGIASRSKSGAFVCTTLWFDRANTFEVDEFRKMGPTLEWLTNIAAKELL